MKATEVQRGQFVECCGVQMLGLGNSQVFMVTGLYPMKRGDLNNALTMDYNLSSKEEFLEAANQSKILAQTNADWYGLMCDAAAREVITEMNL